MRLRAVLCTAVLASVVSGPAAAAPITLSGAISIVVGTLPPIALPVASTTADLTGGTLTVPAGIASVSGVFVPVSGFPLNLITGIVVTASNGAGSFAVPGPADGGAASVPGGAFGGSMPILGVVQVKGALAINVPISVVGQGGSVNAGGIVVEGAPWTAGLAQVTTTGSGMAMFALSGTQSGPLGGVSSTVTLVTPAHIDAGGLQRLPVFASWSLHWIPEPGSALLVGAGIAGLASAARRRPGRPAR
jgi:hypothetical protein